MPGSEPRPVTDEFFFLWVLIAQTKDAMLRARELEYAPHGISNERRAVLYIVQHNGGRATPVQIAHGLFRELHSVTEMLSRMEKDGLVSKHKGSGRSKVEVSLTDEGLRVFEQSLRNETDREILSVLTKRQRERLSQYLWKLRNRTLKHLGIPEWQFGFPEPPDAVPESKERGSTKEEVIA